eukprot:1158079-Pelagomonas_calceolata.AAC.13
MQGVPWGDAHTLWQGVPWGDARPLWQGVHEIMRCRVYHGVMHVHCGRVYHRVMRCRVYHGVMRIQCSRVSHGVMQCRVNHGVAWSFMGWCDMSMGVAGILAGGAAGSRAAMTRSGTHESVGWKAATVKRGWCTQVKENEGSNDDNGFAYMSLCDGRQRL